MINPQKSPDKGMHVLRMLKTPQLRHRLNQEREIELIRPELRLIFKKLILGQSRWHLYMHGTPGGGKTCAALCMLDYTPDPCVYWTMNDLHNDVAKARLGELWTESYPPQKITEKEIFSRIVKANLVVIDEIGMRNNVSDVHYDALKKTIDLRYGKPLVVIGNPDLDGIEQIYDARIRSRLYAGTLTELTTDRRAEPQLRIAANA